jgi:DNA-binding transcriptional ArsR family regulator
MSTRTKTTKTATSSKPTKSQQDKKIDAVTTLLKQMSDKTRYTIMYLLASAEEGEMHVTAICDALQQSQPAISHHLALLRHGGLIEARRAGKNNFYSLTDREIGGVGLGDFVKANLDN